MAIRIALVVVLATIAGYYHVSASLQNQALDQLRGYIAQRTARESSDFQLARDNLQLFTDDFRQRLDRVTDPGTAPDPEVRFSELFEPHSDGSLRLKNNLFERHAITGVIGKHVAVDDDLKRRLILGVEMLTRYGPAWRNRFANLYLVTPENAILMYWPGKPWALNISDWEVSAKLALAAPGDEVLTLDNTTARIADWSGLYFDYAVNDWLVSVTEPLNRDQRNLIVTGLDMPLADLIERTINSHLPGTYNLIFRADGRLLVHPRYGDAIQSRSGNLTVADTDDDELQRIYDLATGIDDPSTIIDNPADDNYLAIARLSGPDWYWVTVFPKSIITAPAAATARWVLLAGVVALLLELLILYGALRRQVAVPLNRLITATDQITTGDFEVRLDGHRDDEIGHLARSFNTMSQEIQSRERKLAERSTRLAVLNEQLERELTERKRAEQALAEQRDALHQSEKLNALGSLLAGVAHELNNPLSVVVGRSLMLEQTLQDSPQAASIVKIRIAAERCARIVKTFLAMARQQQPHRVPVALIDLIVQALDLVGYGLRADGIDITIELDDDLPVLTVDQDQWVQVFTNLLLNAQQALSPYPAGKQIRISASTDPQRQHVAIRISDNGPGIDPTIRTRIFEPFFTTKGIGKGTGIGLSVSRGIVEAHEGQLQIGRSELGGATFELSVPVGNQTDPAVEDDDDSTGHGRQQTILIVDDETDVAGILADILTEAGYRTVTAGDGHQALAVLTDQPVDLIISDLRMPGMDGTSLFTRLSRQWPALTERIVFVTGDTLNTRSRGFLQQAQRPVIEKPFVPADIRRLVGQVLNG